MNRPGPLEELPLERFLPSYANISDNDDDDDLWTGGTRLKRPLSPTSHSPSAKRRQLSIDGRSTTPGSSKMTPRSRYAQSVDFSAVLQSPDSPVKRLNFASISISKSDSPKQDDIETTPRARSRPVPPKQLDGSKEEDVASSSTRVATRSRPHPLVFELVPRPAPPLPDPTSEHYPGFFIYPDPYTVVARPDETRSVEEQVWYDEEPEKENSQPPRQVHALPSAFIDSLAKSSSLFPAPLPKGKTIASIFSSSYRSVAHRRIFGPRSAVLEDDSLDLTAINNYARRAALSSNPLEDDKDGSPSS
ncbi:hypothetical protein CC1G_00171 [Coprinopsis cinerea okayama7|uniref:Uncharacterized protein n=1 Tax=Coprinopsis cinerea (strain Okayama-7 / 130 / ATCC MYA-4618 / FGSC 9003) TaxID=240176 RepID=A8NX08_COPC7|nr:hypothetical protein CC1G_00171 [Coprinopsis cinerea okayama7\|eukprot:XP_001837035.2 hypothetical protein CC1G_00171 [Coprinopsis cinerea okayama7\